MKSKRKKLHVNVKVTNNYLVIIAFVIILTAIIVKNTVWESQTIIWYLNELFHKNLTHHKLTIAPPIYTASTDKILINDASWLNETTISQLHQPTTADEVKSLVLLAKKTGKKISISGIRHSMGGQAFLNDALHLDMTKMDTIIMNEDTSVTVQPGVTWKQLQEVLDGYGRSIAVMQDSNIFTVGGSLSVNAHGKDPRFKNIISTIHYIKLVTSDGQEVAASRTENADLFYAAVGGYGLFGVITEINLQTTANTEYSFTLHKMDTEELLTFFEKEWKRGDTELIEAHLSVDRANLLNESLIYKYTRYDNPDATRTDLEGENNVWLRKAILDFSKNTNFGKIARWELEKLLTPVVDPRSINRNTAMAVPVRFLTHTSGQSTDILQEYFIPTDMFYPFLAYFKEFIPRQDLNLVNVTVRKVPQDMEAALSYAKQDMYAVVVYYSIQNSSAEKEQIQHATQELVEYLNTIHATYYLCYGPYYSRTQLQRMYPEIHTFFQLKNTYDPQGLFSNNWYEQIRNNANEGVLF